MKPFLIKLTTAALNLCNAIVSSLWVLALTGMILIAAFDFMSDPLETDLMLRRFQVLAISIPVMGTYIVSSIALRRVLADGFARSLSAVLGLGVLICFIGHLSFLIGLGIEYGYSVFEAKSETASISFTHDDSFSDKVANVYLFGVSAFLLGVMPSFILYLIVHKAESFLGRKVMPKKAAASTEPMPPSCFDEMFSKHTFLASGILSVVIISFVLLISL